MKKKMKKYFAFFVATVMTLAMLTGCGMKADDAREYVQAALDASYKGDFKEYVKITESTEEEAKALYDGNMEQIMQSLGMGDSMTEEMRAKYEELFKSIFSKAKYTVGEAKETEEGFEVEVQTEQLQLFSELENDLIEEMEKDLSGLEKQPTEEEINTIALENMHSLLTEKLSDPAYGEAQTITVRVTKDEDGVWNISEEDLTAVDEALFR